MKQTITERFGERFYKLFGKNLNDYECWYGFDFKKFKDDFVPTPLLQSEKFRLLDYVSTTFGYEAAKLIDAILEYQTATFLLNGELVGIQDGQVRTFDIVVYDGTTKRRGQIYFPFSIHEEDTEKWTITHLPTGYSIVKNRKREFANDLLIALCVEFTDDLYTDKYRPETVSRLFDFVTKRIDEQNI